MSRQPQLPPVLLPPEIAAQAFDPAAVFESPAPVELEIGSGKGTFLLARAQAAPDINLLGVEWGRPYCQYAAQRVQRAGLANVRLIRADAAVLVGNMPPCSLTRVHIYFPDPWPKARHHHRRLLGTPMLRQLWRVLKPGGLLLIVTDHLGYFEHVRRAMAALRGWAHTAFPAMSDKSGQIVGTNFERKYIAQGRAFYKLSRMKYSR